MDKVSKLIDKIVIIIKVLYMEGKIQKQTHDEIRLSLVDMEDELNKFTITDTASDKSIINMEKLVNEYINYAEVQTMLVELERRGFNVDKIQKEE